MWIPSSDFYLIDLILKIKMSEVNPPPPPLKLSLEAKRATIISY